MPVLKNIKHEIFAQQIAAGSLTGADSAKAAGYEGTQRSLAVTASRLLKDADIAQRVTELRINISAAAAKEAGVSKGWVISTLKENVERSLQHEPVLDSKGEPTGEYRYEAGAVNRGLELIGKELGMFVDRKAITVEDLRKMPADALLNLIAGLDADSGTQGEGEESPIN